MHVRWIRKRTTRLLVGLLLLPALAFRVLVPPGIMPGTGADGAPTMQMCHGAGSLPTAAHGDPTGNGPAPDERPPHEAPCVFAAAGSAAPPTPTAIVLGAFQASAAELARPEHVVFRRAFHRAQSARAPPFDSQPA